MMSGLFHSVWWGQDKILWLLSVVMAAAVIAVSAAVVDEIYIFWQSAAICSFSSLIAFFMWKI